ncbi:hypothetical protein I4F81_003042 [Pyropia yezoensis]|uniref:Uncharacterized protein n=1 Tax=Pyropia yezoensis TaxID=2788 RepID=A0ACC3BR87_PYRYE|nr:hypothetical protein I4F81_003042 [Neopyropia yezoensis]
MTRAAPPPPPRLLCRPRRKKNKRVAHPTHDGRTSRATRAARHARPHPTRGRLAVGTGSPRAPVCRACATYLFYG